MRSHAGLLRLALAFAALLASMSLVVWRDSRALALQSELETMRMNLAISETERSELARRIEYLESRARVVADAGALGLRVPSADEIVILPLGVPSVTPSSRVASAPRRGGDAL